MAALYLRTSARTALADMKQLLCHQLSHLSCRVLQAQFPGQLNIAVDKLEGKTLRQQAALYSNASIVIQTHGAALGDGLLRCNYLHQLANHAYPDSTTLTAPVTIQIAFLAMTVYLLHG